jgi:MYXO-CTERM domain-containing protein
MWLAKIDASASGSASAQCSGGSCTAEAQGKASVGCAVAPGHVSEGAAGGALLLLGLGAAFVSRRRRA